ncbi:MAG TPA: P-loop NTPase fold protein, partial [Steroidobacteraceae bacterium]
IYGPWGSGKTTLMNAVRSKLNEANTVIVEFSAWRYEKEEYLLVPLLDTIREALVAWADRREQAMPAAQPEAEERLIAALRVAAATVGKIATSIVAGISFKVGAPGSIELSFEAAKALERAREFDGEPKPGRFSWGRKSPVDVVRERGSATFPQSVYHTCFRELQSVFTVLRKTFSDLRTNAGDLRFVIFIDDLDRCLPQGALEVLEAIKLFFEHEGFVFVVGLDRSIVERFVEQSYPDTVVRELSRSPVAGAAVGTPVEMRRPLVSGSEYIKKIFQVPFTLAPVQLSQVDDLIDAIRRGSELSDEQFQDLRDCVKPHLEVALGESAVNPREVKRFINAYVLQMKIKEHLDPGMVLALQTINARLDWDAVRTAIEVHRDEFLRALREDVALVRPMVGAEDIVSPLELLDPQLRNLPQSFREYVALDDSVGRKLLDATEGARIADYLYSVESTTSTHGGVLLDVLPLLSKARREVQTAADALANEADKAYGRAREFLDNARSLLGSIEGQTTVRALISQLGALGELMVPPRRDGFDDQQAKAYSAERVLEIDAALRRVRALRRQDSLGAPPA